MKKKDLERALINEVIEELYDSKIMTQEMHDAIGQLNEGYINRKAEIQEENKLMLEEIVREINEVEEEQIEKEHDKYLETLKELIDKFLADVVAKKEEKKEEPVEKTRKYVTRENGQIVIKIKGINE